MGGDNVVERGEKLFQAHEKTVHIKTMLKKAVLYIEGRAGDTQLTELVDEYNGKLPVNSNPNPLPPPPGPSKAGKRPAADVVESAAAPALKRTAHVEPDAAAKAKKPIQKVVKNPTPIIPPEPAAGGGAIRLTGRPVKPAATAAMPVISKS